MSTFDKPIDETEITEDDIMEALLDIESIAPELMEYIISCYPIELMIYMSPEICQRLEALRKSSSQADRGAS